MVTSLIEKFMLWHEPDDTVSRRIRIRDENMVKLNAELAAMELVVHFAREEVQLVFVHLCKKTVLTSFKSRITSTSTNITFLNCVHHCRIKQSPN